MRKISPAEYLKKAKARSKARKLKAKSLWKPAKRDLKKKLDSIFSIYIRLRDKLRNSGRCMICNLRPIEVCFHFISRGDENTRWEPDNCAGSCRGCNYNESIDRRQNNKDRFKNIHIVLVGLGRVRELEDIARRVSTFSEYDLEQKIHHFKSLLLFN